jgi:superoxide dismutase, Fe-Mn family
MNVSLQELSASCFSGDGVLPANGLSVALARDFGSVAAWREEFTAMANTYAGDGGWLALVWLASEGRLVHQWVKAQAPLPEETSPVLVVNLREQASSVMVRLQQIDWEGVYRRYGAAVASSATACGQDPDTVQKLSVSPVVLDVRRAEARDQTKDTIVGAVWRDPAELAQWCQELDPDKPVLVCCVHGLDIGRSSAMALRAMGFDAHYLEGGIEAWREAKLPMQAT